MDKSDLLLKEEEFYKLNSQIEMRTQQLMKEVEMVIVNQASSKSWDRNDAINEELQFLPLHDIKEPISLRSSSSPELSDGPTSKCWFRPRESSIFTNKHHSIKNDTTRSRSLVQSGVNHPRGKPSLCPMKASTLGDSGLGVTVDSKSNKGVDIFDKDILPEAARGMSQEAITRFLKAKARLLQKEVETLQQNYTKRTDDWRRMQEDIRKVEEERAKLQQVANTTKEQLRKQEQASATATNRVQLRDAENHLLRKELDSVKRELKQESLNASGVEIRLNRSTEENERLKQALKEAQHNEKELRDTSRKKQDEMVTSIKRLEKQKLELINAFKKQLQLIDNLKRQKTNLEASRILKYSEEEFLKLLDWNPPS